MLGNAQSFTAVFSTGPEATGMWHLCWYKPSCSGLSFQLWASSQVLLSGAQTPAVGGLLCCLDKTLTDGADFKSWEDAALPVQQHKCDIYFHFFSQDRLPQDMCELKCNNEIKIMKYDVFLYLMLRVKSVGEAQSQCSIGVLSSICKWNAGFPSDPLIHW